MQENIPVLIVHPVTLFREGLRRILSEAQFDAVWCSDRAPAGPIPHVSDKIAPLLVVGHEVEASLVYIAEVKCHYPASRVVLITDHLSGPQLVGVLQFGAVTVLRSASSCEALIGALRLVATGSIVLPSDLLELLLTDRGKSLSELDILPLGAGLPASVVVPQAVRTSISQMPALVSSFANLSTRESNVLDHLLEGLPNKEIAAQLDISEATVKVHVKAILRKARLRNRTQVAMWASRGGFQPTKLPHDLPAAHFPAEGGLNNRPLV